MARTRHRRRSSVLRRDWPIPHERTTRCRICYIIIIVDADLEGVVLSPASFLFAMFEYLDAVGLHHFMQEVWFHKSTDRDGEDTPIVTEVEFGFNAKRTPSDNRAQPSHRLVNSQKLFWHSAFTISFV